MIVDREEIKSMVRLVTDNNPAMINGFSEFIAEKYLCREVLKDLGIVCNEGKKMDMDEVVKISTIIQEEVKKYLAEKGIK